MKLYYVYIAASRNRVLYVGVCNDLVRRMREHRTKLHPHSFTAKYNVDRLVYYEEFTQIDDAIAREKQLKGYSRAKKIALIESMNRNWKDVSTQQDDPFFEM